MIRIASFLVMLSFLSGVSSAAIIASGSGTAGTGTTTVALTAGANAFLSAAPVIVTPAVGNNDVTGAPSPNTVDVALDVYAMDPGSSFSVNFAVSDGAGEQGTTEYWFRVTLTNMLNANGVDPGDAGKEISGLDIAISPGPFAIAGFDSPPPGDPAPGFLSANAFPLQVGGVTGGILRYGGISGGGGGIPFGTSQTFLFGIDIVDLGGIGSNAGSLTLTFTANPEPGTLLLAGMALMPAGVVIRRRRRKSSVKPDPESSVG